MYVHCYSFHHARTTGTAINISQFCIGTGRSYKYGPNGYPTYLENTGNLSAPGQFYLDRKRGLILATLLPAHTPSSGGGVVLPVVLGLQETLLKVQDVHDVEWRNVTFAHTAWTQVRAGVGVGV